MGMILVTMAVNSPSATPRSGWCDEASSDFRHQAPARVYYSRGRRARRVFRGINNVYLENNSASLQITDIGINNVYPGGNSASLRESAPLPDDKACASEPTSVVVSRYVRRTSLRCPHATTASWHASPAGITGTRLQCCRCVPIRRASLRSPHATTASWHASPAGVTGSSSHARLQPVAQLGTINVELANGNLEVVPGHALHKKGLQGQKGVGPLVGSQERKALLVPLINCVQTAC